MPVQYLNVKSDTNLRRKRRKLTGDESEEKEQQSPNKKAKQKVPTHHFPSKENNRELWEKWKNAVPRKNWTPTVNSVLCDKHFLPSDFKEIRLDSNKHLAHQ